MLSSDRATAILAEGARRAISRRVYFGLSNGRVRPVAYTSTANRVNASWVLRTFGNGGPKVFVIREVMQLSDFLGYRSSNFFASVS
jgi:hypothetical protein